ncbi:PTS transporter subunit EIIB, partial [Enterocloster lavalensis]|uniref:PTS transporter subunit EIIB n=1 Tax=Enterocloster lavalensis TaxID=460384 RepID=UPI002FDB9205
MIPREGYSKARRKNMSSQLAFQIVEALGGASNVISIENCMTRLRVCVKDAGLVKRDELSKIKEVLRVVGSDT